MEQFQYGKELHGTILVRQGAAWVFQYGKELHGTISVQQGAVLGDYCSVRSTWVNSSTAGSCMGQFQYSKELH